ncbi:MOSC domain-containing protein [Pseudahrensia aquimaris]|uniref:MOSC domain-containing protein n=1 Tax=Pseudahrensia aquimaris TaxID=744461 RepID=A0ABW3FF05_9HYPH
MQDPFASKREEFDVHSAQKIKGTVAGLFKAQGKDFITAAVDELPLTFEGIPGDFHAGATRKSGGREPWYPRGTLIRNERQLSLLAPDELRTIARRLDVPEVRPEWIGGNLLLDGIDCFTMLPPRTLLFFEGGVTIKIDGDNGPCRLSGRSISQQFEGRQDIENNFSRVAQQLRGLVAWVEKPGTIKMGEGFEARIPPQWIYRA